MDTKKECAEIEAAAVALKMRIYAAIVALHADRDFDAARPLEELGDYLQLIVVNAGKALKKRS